MHWKDIFSKPPTDSEAWNNMEEPWHSFMFHYQKLQFSKM